MGIACSDRLNENFFREIGSMVASYACGSCPDFVVEVAFDIAASYCPVERANSKAKVAQLLACMEINWSLPWGKPLS